MQILASFTGSDARWLVCTHPTDLRKVPYIWLHRLRCWLLKWVVSEYVIPHEYLANFIRLFDPRARFRVVPSTLRYTEVLPKVPHKEFNIMYYYPEREYNKRYCRWCYGADVVEQIVRHYNYHPHVRFIRVDGSKDLTKIFPYVDFYLRPNRHDGDARLKRECELQGIPVYWSQCNPSLYDATLKIEMALFIRYGNEHQREPVDSGKVN